MDDIASALGISKRTLYETVQSRDELIKLCCKTYGHRLRDSFEAVINKNCSSTFESLLNLNELFIAHIRNTHKSFLEELKKNAKHDPHGEEAKELQFEYFERLLKTGQEGKDGKQPEIEPSMKPEIMSRLLLSQLRCIAEDPMFDYSKFSYFEVFASSWQIFMRGIATDYGKEVIDTWISNNPTHTLLTQIKK